MASGVTGVFYRHSINTIPGLEQEIDRVQTILSELKRQRNALLPVSRLPPEVLSRIFLLVLPPINSARIFEPVNKSWVGLSHVSYIWRATAVDCAAMWTYLPWVGEEVLARSRTLPIHANVNLMPTTNKWEVVTPMLSILARSLTRIQTLSVTTSWNDFQREIAPAIHAGVSTPDLSTLR